METPYTVSNNLLTKVCLAVLAWLLNASIFLCGHIKQTYWKSLLLVTDRFHKKYLQEYASVLSFIYTILEVWMMIPIYNRLSNISDKVSSESKVHFSFKIKCSILYRRVRRKLKKNATRKVRAVDKYCRKIVNTPKHIFTKLQNNVTGPNELCYYFRNMLHGLFLRSTLRWLV